MGVWADAQAGPCMGCCMAVEVCVMMCYTTWLYPPPQHHHHAPIHPFILPCNDPCMAQLACQPRPPNFPPQQAPSLTTLDCCYIQLKSVTRYGLANILQNFFFKVDFINCQPNHWEIKFDKRVLLKKKFMMGSGLHFCCCWVLWSNY